jgi:hypothetical protein
VFVPRLLVLVPALALAGCAGPTGRLAIYVEAEDTITNGIAAGSAEEDVQDGWSVHYDDFIVALGEARVSRRATGETRASGVRVVVDLAALTNASLPLDTFDAMTTARWDVVGYAALTPRATDVRHDSVSQGDFDAMVAAGCTYLVRGTISSPTGQSCAPGTTVCVPETDVHFRFCVPAPVDYGPCSSPDGMPGVAVAASGTSSAQLTLHGDHLWFDSFPSGSEGTTSRRAQWLADADLDHDGEATQGELERVRAATLFTTARGYSLAGAFSFDGRGIVTAWDFARAQLATSGHFFGEGECPRAPAPSGT